MLEKLSREWRLRNLEKRIQRFGWHAMYIGKYGSEPCWCYSMGFESSLGQPEVIVFDVPYRDANTLMNWIYQSIESGDLVPRDGEIWRPADEVVGTWRSVHPSHHETDEAWFAAGLALRERAGITQPYRAFQLVARDAEGHFPWDPKYDERLRHLQPALYLPLEEQAPRLATDAAV